MKKVSCIKNWLLSLLIVPGEYVVAQNNLPPIYEIRTDTIPTAYLESRYWQMLPDAKGKWTINDVTRSPLSENFYSRIAPPNNGDTITHTYWFRYRLKSLMNSEAKIAIHAHFEEDSIFVIYPDGRRDQFLTGDFVAWHKKDGLKANNQIPLVLEPAEEIMVYDRGKNHVAGIPENFSVDVASTEKIHQDYVRNTENGGSFFSVPEMENAFLVGVLLIPFFLNLFFFRITKEKEYLYFSLFVILLAITRLLNPVATYWYWRDRSLEPYVGYFNICWILIPFFLVQFIRNFFKTYHDYPRWDKLILTLAILAGLILLTFELMEPSWALSGTKHLVTRQMIFINDIVDALGNLSIALTFAKYRGRKNLFMNLVIIGGLPLMLFWALEISMEGFVRMGIMQNFISQSQYFILEILCIIWFVLLFTLVLLKRFNRLRIENAQQALDKERLAKEKETERALLIEHQKTELAKTVEERTFELKRSLEDLKSTQAQLIQSEKMASLGELTAGIAHEIQNPLNFVNNFSELNKELITEMNHEIESGNFEAVKNIGKDIEENEEKINVHGRRADGIVKSMLQHSRASSGKKEPTDINALCDEYFRLAYHGLRAKDKTFNATMKTEYDPTIGKVNVMAQDIGRVILNLITNAFYSVTEKKRSGKEAYEPTVSISTKKTDDKIEIKVTDNGNGIPQKVLDKIFQPFFTTKPTGQGTGLGLSLSYDIIKSHGGELKVNTREKEFAEFTILLPP